MKTTLDSVKKQIEELSENIRTVKNGEVVFKIISWPYSRDLVKTMLYKNSVKYTYERLGKLHDQFTIASNEEVITTLKEGIKIVNAFAKESGIDSKGRGDLVAKISKYLNPDMPEEVKPVKEPKVKAEKAPKAPKAKAEKVVAIKQPKATVEKETKKKPIARKA